MTIEGFGGTGRELPPGFLRERPVDDVHLVGTLLSCFGPGARACLWSDPLRLVRLIHFPERQRTELLLRYGSRQRVFEVVGGPLPTDLTGRRGPEPGPHRLWTRLQPGFLTLNTGFGPDCHIPLVHDPGGALYPLALILPPYPDRDPWDFEDHFVKTLDGFTLVLGKDPNGGWLLLQYGFAVFGWARWAPTTNAGGTPTVEVRGLSLKRGRRGLVAFLYLREGCRTRQSRGLALLDPNQPPGTRLLPDHALVFGGVGRVVKEGRSKTQGVALLKTDNRASQG